MIDSQNIHDALCLLPDDLIAPVDALRRKPRIPWMQTVSIAACLALCVGLWCFFPGLTRKNGAGEAAPENGSGLAGESSHSYTSTLADLYQIYEICEVRNDSVTVVPVSISELSDNINVQAAVITVTFEKLETVPDLKSGQHIRIYFDEPGSTGTTVHPNRIEIIKEEEK